GAAAVDGRSGGLGGPADRKVFAALRSLADVVLVAAGTARDENYGPAKLPIAVVSGSLRLDWDTPFFTDAVHRPIVITAARAPAEAVKQAETMADVLIAGDAEVDLAAAVAQLGERGFTHVLAEGGPSFNGSLAAAALIDELCLTFAPVLVAGDAKRIIAGSPLQPPAELTLRSLCEEDGYLFFRYRLPGR
ncbi:MAG TPA: dihydrofolate reductase family protein, partial [Acidimicrobiia bacterium]|nr:dihydrofolate reductase family protein [Acidimicrobiia bacterium]